MCLIGSLCRLKRGTRDWKRAYRQLPWWVQHAAYHIVCAWHPERHQWQFAEPLTLCFDLLASVVRFSRCPALMLQSFIVGTDCLELLETLVDFFVMIVKVDCMIVGHCG